MKQAMPYLLIALGLIFLLENYGIMEDAFSKLWPVLVIIIGASIVGRE